MLEIYIIRHGQDRDNAAGILNGRRNEPLTKIGVMQGEDLAEHLEKEGYTFDAVYCSPLQRVYRTAEITTDKLHLPKPIVLDLLIERDFGVMTGKFIKDIVELCAPNILKTETITYFLNPEGAETFPQMVLRAKKILAYITERHKDGKILLATHGDTGKMLYTAYYNLNWEDVLRMFHFGNSEMLLLSENSKPEDTHVFTAEQFNN